MTLEIADSHWTRRLFVEKAELYLPVLEQARERAGVETDVLLGLLAGLGVPENAKVLDVACGIGRHSVPLARSGYRVVGMDLSPLFIERASAYATEAGVDARFIEGDLREVERLAEGDAPFDVIVNMFTSHGYYGKATDLDLFRQLRRLAAPSAVLVVMTANRDWIVRNFQPEGIEEAGPIRILERRRLDLETSTIRNDWEFYENESSDGRLLFKQQMDLHVYSLHELREVVEQAGWRYVRGLGQAERTDEGLVPVTPASKVMWVVARAA